MNDFSEQMTFGFVREYEETVATVNTSVSSVDLSNIARTLTTFLQEAGFEYVVGVTITTELGCEHSYSDEG